MDGCTLLIISVWLMLLKSNLNFLELVQALQSGHTIQIQMYYNNNDQVRISPWFEHAGKMCSAHLLCMINILPSYFKFPSVGSRYKALKEIFAHSTILMIVAETKALLILSMRFKFLTFFGRLKKYVSALDMKTAIKETVD